LQVFGVYYLMYFLFFFFAVLRTSWWLGRLSTTWATPPAITCFLWAFLFKRSSQILILHNGPQSLETFAECEWQSHKWLSSSVHSLCGLCGQEQESELRSAQSWGQVSWCQMWAWPPRPC
jgi:hypothetical protein